MARSGTYSVSTRIAVRIVDTAAGLGVPPHVVCEDAGVDGSILADTDGRIDLRQYGLLWEAAAAKTGERGLPLRVATHPNGMENILQFVAKTAPSLLEGLKRSAHYLRVLTNGSNWSIHEDDDVVVVRVTHAEPETASIYAAEFALADIVERGRVFSGVRWSPRAVRFAHAAPADVAAHHAFFKAPIHFSSPATELAIDRRVASLPLIKADEGMSKFFQQYLDEILNRSPTAVEDVLHRARLAIAENMQGEAPTLSVLARKLGMGSRTLRRRLADEGTTFSRFLDEHRRVLAESYLQSEISISEAAFLLGFSNPSAFHRAFRRWFGVTPQQFRADRRSSVPRPVGADGSADGFTPCAHRARP